MLFFLSFISLSGMDTLIASPGLQRKCLRQSTGGGGLSLFVGKDFNKIRSVIPECHLKPREDEVTGCLILPAIYICCYSHDVTSISVSNICREYSQSAEHSCCFDGGVGK